MSWWLKILSRQDVACILFKYLQLLWVLAVLIDELPQSEQIDSVFSDVILETNQTDKQERTLQHYLYHFWNWILWFQCKIIWWNFIRPFTLVLQNLAYCNKINWYHKSYVFCFSILKPGVQLEGWRGIARKLWRDKMWKLLQPMVVQRKRWQLSCLLQFSEVAYIWIPPFSYEEPSNFRSTIY